MITVFGSLNADLCFEIARCPQAGETIASTSMTMHAGGKGGNQALAAAKAGAQVTFVGAVGSDDLAALALSGLKAAGVDLSGVRRDQGRTGCAAILIDESGDNRIVLSAGANGDVNAAQLLDSDLAKSRFLLMQMEIPEQAVVAAIDLAREAGVRTILNLAPAGPLPPDALRKVDLLVVNESEAEFVAGMCASPSDARSLAAALGTGVIRTLGADGVEACIDGISHRVAGIPVDVVDTTAAGDCFIGVLAAELDAGQEIGAALSRATTASALTCTRRGSQTSLPSTIEVNDFLSLIHA
ncbi:ribokinase [Defluviimonas sp. SAOS-178_SWC]|uniref:ribokinase n=1 Tax=Defluviimonas sp. SAOS-178_SWC TaxID=3121287 RepID=UPI0032217E32